MRILILIIIFFPKIHFAQNVEEIIENIYQRTVKQNEQMQNMPDYSLTQSVHFIKRDGDGDIDEQSKRTFEVFVRGDLRKRNLISALEYENGEWTDITEKLKNKKLKSNHYSKDFSLAEMVHPDNRQEYEFTIAGMEKISGSDTYHLKVKPYQKSEEKFTGDMWVDATDYLLLKAKLIPSDFPSGIEHMVMRFKFAKVENYLMPDSITFDAKISFLLFIKGQIQSEIVFDSYRFNQTFDDSLFVGLEEGID